MLIFHNPAVVVVSGPIRAPQLLYAPRRQETWESSPNLTSLRNKWDATLTVQKPTIVFASRGKRDLDGPMESQEVVLAKVICERCDELTDAWLGTGPDHVWT